MAISFAYNETYFPPAPVADVIIRANREVMANEVILGRDVLNHLIITLDGIAGTTEIS